MEKNKPQISIKVLDKPETFIMIDADKNPEEAKFLWLKKHSDIKAFLPMQQKRREAVTLRSNRVLQRTKYKQR